MYECNDCGYQFEDGNYCQHCGSDDLYELKQCEGCAEWFDDLHGGYCDDCLSTHNDLETCHRIGEHCKTNYKLNGIWGYIFTDEQIEEILLREAENADVSKDLKNFIEEDKDWFGETLSREVI